MTKKYLKEHNLLAVPFYEGTGICVMKCKTYKNKINDILKLTQCKKIERSSDITKDFCLKEEARLYGLAKLHRQSAPVRSHAFNVKIIVLKISRKKYRMGVFYS